MIREYYEKTYAGIFENVDEMLNFMKDKIGQNLSKMKLESLSSYGIFWH